MKVSFILILLLFTSCSDKNHVERVDSYLEINGNKIHYKINGIGKELIMVHGGYLDLNMWNEQVGEFENGRKIIRFSDLGHGKTKSKNSPILGFEIIEKLTSATKENPTTLIGLSWGAMICVDYTLNHPENVDKLILVSPGLSGWKYFQDTIAAKNYELRQIAIRNNDIEEASSLFHQNWVIGPRREKSDINIEFYEWSLDNIKNNMKNHWGEDWSKLDSIPAIKRLNQINVPTYIIIGSEDGEDIKLIAEEYKQNILNSKKIILDDVAHLLNVENPKEFNKHLKSILNEE